MNTTLILVALIVFAFAVSRLLHRYADRLSMYSGVEYVLVGIALGWLVEPELFESLDLLIDLLLGLLGFMIGLRARELFRRFEHLMAGTLAAFAVTLAVAFTVLGLVQWLEPSYLADPAPVIDIPVYTDGKRLFLVWGSGEALWLALALGAAAAVSSSSAITAAADRWKAEGPPVRLLTDLATAGQVVAVLVIGVALAGDRALEAADRFGMSVVEWAMLSSSAGAITGLLFTVFIGGAKDDMRLFVVAIGAVIFAAGIGAALGISPLFVNLICGLTVAATSDRAHRLQRNLARLHHPVAIMLLVFAGIAWRPPPGWMWLIPAAYFVVRTSVRLLASRLAVATFVQGVEYRKVGGGLIAQGSLAAAIVLSFAERHPETASIALSAVIGPMLLSELFASRSLRRVLADSGAIRPRLASLDPDADPDATHEVDDEAKTDVGSDHADSDSDGSHDEEDTA